MDIVLVPLFPPWFFSIISAPAHYLLFLPLLQPLPSPVLLSKPVSPSECQRIDAFRQPCRFKDTRLVNFFTEGAGRNFQGARTKTHISPRSLTAHHPPFFAAFTSFSLYVLDLSSPTLSLTQASFLCLFLPLTISPLLSLS